MKINLPKLVLEHHSTNEIISDLNVSIVAMYKELQEAIEQNNWGKVGEVKMQMSYCAGVVGGLDEKLNGQKVKVVL